MKFLKSAAMCSLLFPFVAMAQEPAAPAAAPAVAPAPPAATAPAVQTSSPEKKITTYGRIAAIMNLYQSDKNSSVNFTSYDPRFGFNFSEGNVFGNIETGLWGQEFDAAGAPDANHNTIYVRAANGGIKLGGFTVSLGRVRPTGASAWGADEMSGPYGWGSVDGLMLAYNLQGITGFDIKLEGTIGNGLCGAKYASMCSLQGLDGFYLPKRDKAMVGTAVAKVNGIVASISYGTEADQVYGHTAAGVYSVRNVNQLEIGVGYETTGASGGVFYSVDRKEKGKNAASENGKITGKTDNGTAAEKFFDYGIGGGVNSTLWGQTGLLQGGDRYGFDLSVERIQTRNDAISNSVEEDSDDTKVALDGYYNAGGMTFLLGFTSDNAKEKVYPNQKGEAGKEKSRNWLYTKANYTF